MYGYQSARVLSLQPVQHCASMHKQPLQVFFPPVHERAQLISDVFQPCLQPFGMQGVAEEALPPHAGTEVADPERKLFWVRIDQVHTVLLHVLVQQCVSVSCGLSCSELRLLQNRCEGCIALHL
jgi:hypothetical protein